MIKVHLPPQKPLVISLIVLGILMLAAVPSYYFYDKYQKSQQLLKNPTEAARAEVKTLVERVSRHIELPEEVPTVATVSDKEKLAEQAFFQKAENGDKVLIYTQARKAILYRASTDKIIEVSTVNLGGVTGAATSSAEVKSSVKVAIYNGTNSSGLASKVGKELAGKLGNIQVVVREDAKKKNYQSSLVVALSKDKEQETKQIASFLGAQISSFPEGEVKPEAEILVILGSDYLKK